MSNQQINNARHERENIRMIEHPEAHCVAYARKMLIEGTLTGFKSPIDRDSVIRLTADGRRENWKPDSNSPEDIVLAFLHKFKTMCASELSRFGATPKTVFSMLRDGILERVATCDNRNFYQLKTKGTE